MPIDSAVALSATPVAEHIMWDETDVVRYHLALGAGHDPLDPRELEQATESGSAVLPTFAVVAPTLAATGPPRVSYPGVDVDLGSVLHASQRVELFGPIPRRGDATCRTGVADLHDKRSAAVVVVDTQASTADGDPLWTSSMRMFVRGEGGFGGHRGTSGVPGPPARRPDHEIVTPTLPQQALWYRQMGDRNPLHSDPAAAAAAGFPRPILHGLCTYGMVARAIVDEVLGGAADAVRAVEARFSGVVFPGETLRTSVWRDTELIVFTTDVDDRDGVHALTGGVIEVVGR